MYVVSPVAAVTAIVMMRWGPFAAIHAAAGGALYCLISGGGTPQLLVFTVGNLGGMAGLLFLLFKKKEDIRQSTGLTMGFGAACQCGMLLGRALMALICGLGTESAVSFITTDILSLIFTLVILWVARRVNGLFEDQKHYLFRIQREAAEGITSDEIVPSIADKSVGRGSHS